MSDRAKKKQNLAKKRAARVRSRILGTKDRLRLCVFRSLRSLFCQAIDDEQGKTVASLHSKTLKISAKKTDVAYALGEKLAVLLKEKGVNTIVFDRGRYAYHGRVKACADGLRSGGIKF